MKKYKYLAKMPCHFTIDKQDYSLHYGEEYTLPDCGFVKSLIAQNRLIEINVPKQKNTK